MRLPEHIVLCDDCGSQMVHGVCALCGHADLEYEERDDDPRELDFNDPDFCVNEKEYD